MDVVWSFSIGFIGFVYLLVGGGDFLLCLVVGVLLLFWLVWLGSYIF